jgi:hypothetical protein
MREKEKIAPSVCTENLNPDMVVMESAEVGERFDTSSSLDLARDRRIMIEALAADRPDQSFGKAILPR